MITADLHLHTVFSSDSNMNLHTLINTASSSGLSHITITDHFDYDHPDLGAKGLIDIPLYLSSIRQASQQMRDTIHITAGLELGFQDHLIDRNDALTSAYNFDFVIGSVHNVNGADLGGPGAAFFQKRTMYEAREAYLSSILYFARRSIGFDVVGHVDYIVRYGNPERIPLLHSDHRDLLDELFHALIDRGKGIEINTSGLRYKLGYPHPHATILKRYRELGGEIITIGSDAHRACDVASGFGETENLLKSLGFSYYCVFRNRKPEFIPL
jgi:histidinol-phosphatase (PHP family)